LFDVCACVRALQTEKLLQNTATILLRDPSDDNLTEKKSKCSTFSQKPKVLMEL